MNDLVSVVIPTFNYGHFVADAVASALAQTYRPTEIIVVDDGSSDDTQARLTPYLDRIRYIRQENQGLSVARNTGIQAASGTWIALLDADDAWHPRKLEMQLAFVRRHPEIGVLGTDTILDRPREWPAPGELPQRGPDFTVCELVYKVRFAPSSAVIRRDCFERAGLFDPELRSAEDRDMWVRIACHFPVTNLPMNLCWYRMHANNMSRAAVRMEENELKVLDKAFRDIPSLRRRWLFRMKTYSYAAYNAAYMHGAACNWLTALARLGRSMALWPLPFPRSDVGTSFARPKMAAVNLLRWLRLKRPEALPQTVNPVAPQG